MRPKYTTIPIDFLALLVNHFRGIDLAAWEPLLTEYRISSKSYILAKSMTEREGEVRIEVLTYLFTTIYEFCPVLPYNFWSG